MNNLLSFGIWKIDCVFAQPHLRRSATLNGELLTVNRH